MTKVPVKEKIAYGLGDLASNLIWTMLMVYLVYFYTDVYGISASAAGTIILVVRVFDAAINPIIGLLADRTSSRWGKFKPYILFGSLPFGICAVLTFSSPDLSATHKVIYASLTYSALTLMYTIVNIPYSALSGVITDNSGERESVSTFRFIFAFIGVAIVQFGTLHLVDLFGNGNNQLGFQLTMLLFAVLAVLMFLITFIGVQERLAPQPDGGNHSIRLDIADIMQNKPWLILSLVSIISMSYFAIRTSAVMYYFKYVIKDEYAVPLFLAGGTLFLMLGVMSTKYLTSRFNKVRLYSFLLYADGVVLGALYFAGTDNIVLINILHYLACFFIGPYSVILWVMYADTADYSEWKTGRRATGLIFSASVLSQKIGAAVGGACVAYVLSHLDFQANRDQSESVIFGITLLMSLIPAALCFICATLLQFYNLNNTKMLEIENELRVRRATYTS